MSTHPRARRRTLAAVALAAGLVGCVPATHSDAEPHQMPNFDDFTAAPVENYLFTFSKGRYGDFSTPYDITCHFYALPKPNSGPSQEIKCEGAVLPGMDDIPFAGLAQPGPDDCTLVSARPSDSGPDYVLHRSIVEKGCPGGARYTPPNQYSLLDVGQKLSYQNMTCAVGADPLIACLDTTSGEHGFVLRPSGSWAF
jgi:hypothetical protein